jgi:hypothetical protein
MTILWAGTGETTALAGVPRFEPKVIDPHVGNVVYAVTKADVNGDGKVDIVALSENRVQWYEAPSWTKHIILEDQLEPEHVCIAPADIDGDGKVDFAIGAGWIKANSGTIQWITRGAKPEDKWSVHFISKEKTTHRMTFADVLGKGQPQLVVSPLKRSVDGAMGVRLLAFEIPGKPKTDRWPLTVLDQSVNSMHAHTHADWDVMTHGPLDSIVAGEEGVFLVERKGDSFAKTLLGTGASGEKPETRGAGEVKVGRLNRQRNFLATVEPMHGTSAVVYVANSDGSLPMKRIVLENQMKQGHAVWTVDLDKDGTDEIVVGHREAGTGEVKGPGLYVFSAGDDSGLKWSKHVIDDGGVAVEDALAEDFTGDGLPDLVAGGRATHNLMLYVNLGQGK